MRFKIKDGFEMGVFCRRDLLFLKRFQRFYKKSQKKIKFYKQNPISQNYKYRNLLLMQKALNAFKSHIYKINSKLTSVTILIGLNKETARMKYLEYKSERVRQKISTAKQSAVHFATLLEQGKKDLEKINTAVQNFSLFGIPGFKAGFLVGYSMISLFPVTINETLTICFAAFATTRITDCTLSFLQSYSEKQWNQIEETANAWQIAVSEFQELLVQTQKYHRKSCKRYKILEKRLKESIQHRRYLEKMIKLTKSLQNKLSSTS
uniref:Uncharacterized protein n=1 Tax=Panagrolaimus superbus TaxID=310955 RepID=A0A914YYB4_9BILA